MKLGHVLLLVLLVGASTFVARADETEPPPPSLTPVYGIVFSGGLSKGQTVDMEMYATIDGVPIPMTFDVPQGLDCITSSGVVFSCPTVTLFSDSSLANPDDMAGHFDSPDPTCDFITTACFVSLAGTSSLLDWATVFPPFVDNTPLSCTVNDATNPNASCTILAPEPPALILLVVGLLFLTVTGLARKRLGAPHLAA